MNNTLAHRQFLFLYYSYLIRNLFIIKFFLENFVEAEDTAQGEFQNIENCLNFVPSVNGSTRLVTNASGLVISRVEYKPYGEVIKTQSNGPDNFRHKYTGQEHDSETSLSYYGARYYDAQLGRFLTQDIMFDPNLGPKRIQPLYVRWW